MKETFYFSHDYNARSDEKIKKLLVKHGFYGYGIFWAIIEDLYNNANALRTDYDCIAFDLRTDEVMIKSIINDFDLFIINDGFFGSLSVERRLNERNEKSAKARESANKRWEKIKNDANAMRTQCKGNAIKDSIVKEKKVKDSIEVITTKVVSPEHQLIKDFLLKHFDEKYVTQKAIATIETLKKKYSAKNISKAVEWGRSDSFWCKNFLSPNKLNQKDKSGVLYIDIFLENSKQINNGKTNKPTISRNFAKQYTAADGL